MLKFYYHTTPNPFKVALILEELGLDYDTIPVDTRKGEQHEPDFLKLNPNAKLPVIDDNGTVVFDSNAILLYLARKHGRFMPAADDGVALSWFFFIATGLSPFSGQAVHFTRVHTESDYATNRYSREIARHYKVLDDHLEANEWIGGSGYDVADIAAWGWVAMAPFVLEAQGGLESYPNVKAWFDRVNERPAAARAMALKSKFAFKTDMDDQAKRAMFPQNF